MKPEPNDEARHVADLIDRIGRLARTDAHEGSLNPAQWEAMRFLHRANRFSRTPGAVSEFLGATKGTVSQTLIALERKGLVRRSPGDPDRRTVTVSLTETGARAIAQDPLDNLAQAVRDLADDRRSALNEGLRGLLAAVQARSGRRSFGQCRTCRYFRRNGALDDPDGPHRCGLLDVPLRDMESRRICIEHEPQGEARTTEPQDA